MYISISHLPSFCFSSLTQPKCDGRNGQPIRHKMGAIGKYPTHPKRFPILFSLLLRLCCGLCATSVNDETSPAFGFQTFLSQIFISPFKPSVFRIYMVCVSNQPIKPTAGEHSQRVFALCSAKSSQLRARPTLPCLTHGLP